MSFLEELSYDLIRLQGLICALDVVADAASITPDGVEAPPHVKRAREAEPVLIETIEQHGEALIQKVGRAALEENKAARGRGGAE